MLTGFLLASLGSGVSQICFSPIIGQVAGTFGVSLGIASFGTIGMMIFLMAVGMPLSGIAADRFGPFPCLIGSQLLFVSTFLLLFILPDSFILMVGLRILQGLCAAAVAGALTPAVSRYFPVDQMGRAMGLQAIGMPLGMMVGLAVIPRLVTYFGDWKQGVACVSAFGVIALLPILWSSLRLPSVSANRPMAGDASALKTALRSPLFRYGVVVSILLYATGFPLTDLAPGFLAVASPTGLGLGPQRAGDMMALLMVSGLVAPMLAGFITDWVFRGQMKWVAMIGWVCALLPPLIILPAVSDHLSIITLLFLIGGFAQPFVAITLMTSAARTFPPSVVGRVAGFWLSFSFFSAAIGTMLGSLGLHITGGYALPLIIVWIGNLLGLLFTAVAADPVQLGGGERQ